MNTVAPVLKDVEYEQPLDGSDGAVCSTKHAWAKVPPEPGPAERAALKDKVRRLLKAKNAVMVSHYYVHPDLQDLAEETGGIVSDSLEMARFGRDHAARTLVVSGVRFMGETAKILSPEKTILMPDLDATCSLDLGCPADAFSAFCDQHPDRTVVVYANTSAAVKARADWVVTSSIGEQIVAHLHARGEKILWAPDRHLGHYIQQQTGADMLLWNGACVVHDEFKAGELAALKRELPQAAVLVHPEAPAAVAALADVVGSTTQLIAAIDRYPTDTFIVASDRGILYEMGARHPDKRFLPAPTAGQGAACKSCAMCPWMAMNSLAGIEQALRHGHGEITLDPALAQAARQPIERMLQFAAQRGQRVRTSGSHEQDASLFTHHGVA